MTGEVENLVLEQLGRIRGGIDGLTLEIVELKSGMTSLEGGVAHRRSDIAPLHEAAVSQTRRIDGVEERLGRIERRIDLVEV